jgi:starvation-inducible outer membrane lipoprotein
MQIVGWVFFEHAYSGDDMAAATNSIDATTAADLHDVAGARFGGVVVAVSQLRKRARSEYDKLNANHIKNFCGLR